MKPKPCFLFSLVALLSCGCSELSGEGDVKSSAYASYQMASKAGAFELGWLPRALPNSATNIVETHNLDSSELWLSFRYGGNEIRLLAKGCVINGEAQLPDAYRTKRDAAWWPSELVEGSELDSRRRWVIFSCPSMKHAQSEFNASMAVDSSRRTAWYWIAK